MQVRSGNCAAATQPPLDWPEAGRCRTVTAAEIAHYQQHGWVKLERFAGSRLVAELLALAQRRMGMDGDSNARGAVEGQTYFNAEYCGGYQDLLLRPAVLSCGRNAKLLMDRGNDTQTRYFVDILAPKLPADTATRHGSNKRTNFHQDFSSWALDRSGGMTFWIALTDLTPEAGTMQFLSGSQRMGALGAAETHHGRDLTSMYPRLLTDYPASAPISYQAGDATVHSALCVHGAGANHTTHPRWAYLVLCNPADACWTGARSDNLDTATLTQWKPLTDERFPIVSV